MNRTETHLFILWNKALEDTGKIIAGIEKEFSVLSVDDIYWDNKKFFTNFCRFYTNSKAIIFWKLLHCGRSPFRLIIVRDDKPEYTERKTNAGVELVNTHMFDCKKRFRSMLKNGHLIHGSNSVAEFTCNYMMLTGTPPPFQKFESMAKWNGEIGKITPVVPGEKPWKDLAELFDFLREFKPFLVMRNFENLPDSCQLGPHSDIDIMTAAPAEFCRLLNLKRASRIPRRAVWRVRVADSYVNMDIRSPGDGYYPDKMAESMIESRIVNGNGIPVPGGKDYFYSLLYHALIHKYALSEEYRERLVKMARALSIFPQEKEDEKTFLLRLLHDYMKDNAYSFVEPRDLTVNFNNDAAGDGKLSLSLLRNMKNILRRILKKG